MQTQRSSTEKPCGWMQLKLPPAKSKSSRIQLLSSRRTQFHSFISGESLPFMIPCWKQTYPNLAKSKITTQTFFLFFEAVFCILGPESFYDHMQGALGKWIVFMKPIMYGVKINVLPSLEGYKLKTDGLIKGKTATSSPAPPLPYCLFSKAFILV